MRNNLPAAELPPIERENDLGYAAYGLIDPRTEEMFWVGAGTSKTWRYRAGLVSSDGKARRISEIIAAGYDPEPQLISYCATREQAMALKVEYCRLLRQAFRGSPVRAHDRSVYRRWHGKDLVPNNRMARQRRRRRARKQQQQPTAA